MIVPKRIAAGPGSALALVGLLILGACATPPENQIARAEWEEANDPLEPTNRAIFDFNMTVDDWVIKPVAQAYRDTVPDDARNSVNNFFNNLGEPVTWVNDLMQGEFGRAAETATRFIFNSTVGFFGFFDVAGEYGLERHVEDFGQTLAVWGVGEGPYLMLPILGPSNVRDTAGRVVDVFLDPFTYVVGIYDIGNTPRAASLGANALEGIDTRSRNIETLDEIEKNALDFYASLRSLYRQNRNSEILNGEVQEFEVPEIDEN